MKLSIVVPVFNEVDYIKQTVTLAISQVVSGIDEREVIIVDDGSLDRTQEIVEELMRRFPCTIKFLRHACNRGKGAALRTAWNHVEGDVVLIQDADLEYDPRDYERLLNPILNGDADVVYGSRFVGSSAKRVLFFWHMIGNRLLTLLSNMTTNLSLTDMETGYKAFSVDVIKCIRIEEDRFGVEPELTAKVAAQGVRVYEVGISYCGRTYAQGKKVSWRDGVRALRCIVQYWIQCRVLSRETLDDESIYKGDQYEEPRALIENLCGANAGGADSHSSVTRNDINCISSRALEDDGGGVGRSACRLVDERR